MPIPANVAETLQRDFPTIRARLIELAAALDRIDRADGSVDADPRIEQIRRSLDVLSSSESDRTEQIQMIFSLPYDPRWQDSDPAGQ